MQSILDLLFLPQDINLLKDLNLPQDIKSKILLYYWSYGTPSANIIRLKIKDTIINQKTSLWFEKVDYIYNHRIYLLQKSTRCSFNIICDLRLAIIDYNILNGITNDILKAMQKNVINNQYTLTKNTLLQLLEEEEDMLIY